MGLEENVIPNYVGKGNLIGNLSQNAVWILNKKYLRRNEEGEICENPGEAVYRLARTMAEVERIYGAEDPQVEEYTKEFYDIIADGEFIPAGRVWTNAGTEIKGLFNCYVLPVKDDLEAIFESVKEAAIIHKNGGGTGYNFSNLRPRGTYVQKSKGMASGPISFMGQFDKETDVINSGNRRGANMGILNVDHPNIFDFINTKSKKGILTNFNVSVGATDEFMEAVRRNDFYDLHYPQNEPFRHEELERIIRNIEENKIGGSNVGEAPDPSSLKFDSKEVVPGQTKIIDSFTGKIAGRVSEQGIVQLYAPYVIRQIGILAHETADPGMIFLDTLNKNNPLPKLGSYEATNPCGEQPLHPHDACNLGSINLARMLLRKNGSYEVDYERLERVVGKAVQFMDNVNDVNEGPIPEVEETVKNHRRIGLGVMGFADMIARLGLDYESPAARDKAREVMGFITTTARKASVDLAKEKGTFPAIDKSYYDVNNPNERVRNVQTTTIAPTGTISMVVDVSSGIEPFFAIAYQKNIRGGDVLEYFVPAFVEECERRGIDPKKVLPLIEENEGSVQGIKEIPEDMQKIFKISTDLDYRSHIEMQAAFQEKTDNAVSKTINMKEDATVDDVINAYLMAHSRGLKGITVYRNNSKEIQVLTTKKTKDLEGRIGTMDNPFEVPSMSPAVKIRQRTPWGNLHVTIVVDPKNNYAPVETFANLGNAGSVETADMESLGRLSSQWLRCGGDMDKIIDQLINIRSGESQVTRDGGVQSLAMGFAKALQKYQYTRREYGMENILTGKVNLEEADNAVSDMMRKGEKPTEKSEEKKGEGGDNKKKKLFSVKCPECGNSLAMEEGCIKCHSCGYSQC